MTTCRANAPRQRTERPPLRLRTRSGHARVVRPLVLWSLVQIAVVVGGVLLGLPFPAIVGVVVVLVAVSGFACRRTVGSLVAGAGLRVAQPFEPGEQIRVYIPSLDSVQDAEIVRVGPANTTLATAGGIVLVPNADMLRGGARA